MHDQQYATYLRDAIGEYVWGPEYRLLGIDKAHQRALSICEGSGAWCARHCKSGTDFAKLLETQRMVPALQQLALDLDAWGLQEKEVSHDGICIFHIFADLLSCKCMEDPDFRCELANKSSDYPSLQCLLSRELLPALTQAGLPASDRQDAMNVQTAVVMFMLLNTHFF